jgi:hypothetical protein
LFVPLTRLSRDVHELGRVGLRMHEFDKFLFQRHALMQPKGCDKIRVCVCLKARILHHPRRHPLDRAPY